MIGKTGLFSKIGLAGLTVGAALLSGQAHAQTNLITNGSFSATTLTASGEVGGPTARGPFANTPNVTGWSAGGLAFLFFPNANSVSGTSADTTGASYFNDHNNQEYLWGPGNGATSAGTPGSNAASNGTEGYNSSAGGAATPAVTGVANGLTNSPDGGNFIAMDGDTTINTSLTQTVSGLQAGGVYKLTFYWAAAEQEVQTVTPANTTEQFNVTFGTSTASTSVISNVAQGFSGWRQATMYFEAGSTSQALTFLAAGTPNGVPPFALLDGVSLVLAPEPTSWAVMLVGLGSLGFLAWRRRSAI